MKYFILVLFLISSTASAAQYAEMKIESKDSTNKNQKFLLKKEKDGIFCSVSTKPWRKIKAKNLEFPLKNMESIEACNKVVVWTSNKKKQQSCYLDTDLVISEIIFECSN